MTTKNIHGFITDLTLFVRSYLKFDWVGQLEDSSAMSLVALLLMQSFVTNL
jgi:hypothetical protein